MTTISARKAAAQGSGGFLAGLVVFVAVGILFYWIFYSANNFDRYTGEGATSFKIGLWMAYGAHLVLSPLVVAAFARLRRQPVWAAALGAILASILLAYPTLGFLNYWNNCIGMEYPLGQRDCG